MTVSSNPLLPTSDGWNLFSVRRICPSCSCGRLGALAHAATVGKWKEGPVSGRLRMTPDRRVKLNPLPDPVEGDDIGALGWIRRLLVAVADGAGLVGHHGPVSRSISAPCLLTLPLKADSESHAKFDGRGWPTTGVRGWSHKVGAARGDAPGPDGRPGRLQGSEPPHSLDLVGRGLGGAQHLVGETEQPDVAQDVAERGQGKEVFLYQGGPSE